MKKQSGPFKLKYKKSAFPFMENFHVKKHGKLKIDRSKKIDDVGSGLEKTGMIEAVKNIKTTKPKSQILDLPKTSGTRGKIGPPPSKKPAVPVTYLPYSGRAIGDAAKKVKTKKFSDKLKSFSDKVSKISDKVSKGGGFKDSPFNPYRRKGLRRFFK